MEKKALMVLKHKGLGTSFPVRQRFVRIRLVAPLEKPEYQKV